jgi:dihydrofolate synthase/folylpolyglutamate synthase
LAVRSRGDSDPDGGFYQGFASQALSVLLRSLCGSVFGHIFASCAGHRIQKAFPAKAFTPRLHVLQIQLSQYKFGACAPGLEVRSLFRKALTGTPEDDFHGADFQECGGLRYPSPMNHDEILRYLEQKGNEVQMMHLGLHRTFAMMRALGDPQRKYASIHIAGTNGKGSVAAIAESILRHAGLATGLYTSPHLVRVEERIQVNGRQIEPRSFAALATRVQKTEAALLEKKTLDRPLTTFEFLTCCAFLHFANKQIDIAVMEVGLGGKLDATNVIHPQVSVITGIALDHQNYLGNSLAEIAGEKAGIIKEHVPVVSGADASAARRVIRRHAMEVDAPLLEFCRGCKIRIRREWRGRYRFDLKTPRREYKNLRLSLAGEYQTRNAALAIMALETLNLFPIKVRDIRRGLAGTRWPGRLDAYHSRRRTLLDGAHNPEGSRLLRDFLIHCGETEVHFVFGAMRDKNIREMGASLFPLAASIHLTPITNARSANPVEVAELHRRFRSCMHLHSNMRKALDSAWRHCSSSGLVVVTGSLYLVGNLLPMVQKHCTR